MTKTFDTCRRTRHRSAKEMWSASYPRLRAARSNRTKIWKATFPSGEILMATKTGIPIARAASNPPGSLSKDEILRYSRHLIMPEVGMDGQLKLKQAKVLCIGT